MRTRLEGDPVPAAAQRPARARDGSAGGGPADGAGRAGIEAGKSKLSSREQQLEAEVAELTTALGEAAVEIRVWKKSAEGRLGPSRTSR